MGANRKFTSTFTLVGALALIVSGCELRDTNTTSLSQLTGNGSSSPNGTGGQGPQVNGATYSSSCVLALQDNTSSLFASTAPNQGGIIDSSEGNSVTWSVYQNNGQPFPAGSEYVFTGTKNGAADMTGGSQYTYSSPSVFNGAFPSGSAATYTRAVQVNDASGSVLCQSTGTFTIIVHPIPAASSNCTLSVVPSTGVTVNGSNVTIQTSSSGSVPVTYAVTSGNLFVNADWIGSGLTGNVIAGPLTLVSPTDFTYNYTPAQAGTYTRSIVIEDDGVGICTTEPLTITVAVPKSSTPPPPPANSSSCVLSLQDNTSGLFASTAPNQGGIIDSSEGNSVTWSVYQNNGQPFPAGSSYIFTGTKNGAADMTGGSQYTYSSPSVFNGAFPSGSAATYTRAVQVDDASGNVLCQSTGTFTIIVHPIPAASSNCTLSVVPSTGVTVNGSNVTIQTSSSGSVPVTYAVTSGNLFVNADWIGSGLTGNVIAGPLTLVGPTDFTYNYTPAQAGTYTRSIVIEDDGVGICTTEPLTITVAAPQATPPPPPPSNSSCVLAMQDTTSGIFASTAPNQGGIIDSSEGNSVTWSVYQNNGQPFPAGSSYIFTGTKNGAADMTGGSQYTYSSPSVFDGAFPSGSAATYTRAVQVDDASGNVLCQSTGTFRIIVNPIPAPSSNCTLSVVPSTGVTVNGSNVTIQTSSSGSVPVTYAVTSGNLFVNAVWIGSGLTGNVFAGSLNLVTPTDFTYNYTPDEVGTYTRSIVVEDDGVAICTTSQLTITVQ